MATATVKNMTNYFMNDSYIIPFTSVISIILLSYGEIRVKLTNGDITLPRKTATEFKTQYLAWLDSQSPKPRSL